MAQSIWPQVIPTHPSPDPINVKQVLADFMGGTPHDLPAAYAAASSITYATSAPPQSLPTVLLLYGGRDHLVKSRFGKQMYNALIASDNQAIFIEIPRAEHAFNAVFNGVSNQLALHFIERFLSVSLTTSF